MKQQLLIVPGWGGDGDSWKSFCSLSNNYFDTSIIELPCFGKEPCPDSVWGVEEYADFLSRKIKELGPVPLILLGHSFGGQVAAYLAACEPHICDFLILSGAAVKRKRNIAKRIFFLPIAKMGKYMCRLPVFCRFETMAKKILYKVSGSPDYNNTSGIKRDILKKVLSQDFSHLLGSIQIPTLVVWGERDTYVPFAFGKRISEQIPGAHFQVIPNAGHGLHQQKPEVLLERIKSFVSEKQHI